MAISFMIACRRFFGMKTGQTLQEFGLEVKQLTDKDRADLTPALSKELGETIEERKA